MRSTIEPSTPHTYMTAAHADDLGWCECCMLRGCWACSHTALKCSLVFDGGSKNSGDFWSAVNLLFFWREAGLVSDSA